MNVLKQHEFESKNRFTISGQQVVRMVIAKKEKTLE
jgi:hypothetical protein